MTPEEPFPENLGQVPDQELQVLDSQVQRQLDREIVTGGESRPETEFRRDELDEECEGRDRSEPRAD